VIAFDDLYFRNVNLKKHSTVEITVEQEKRLPEQVYLQFVTGNVKLLFTILFIDVGV